MVLDTPAPAIGTIDAVTWAGRSRQHLIKARKRFLFEATCTWSCSCSYRPPAAGIRMPWFDQTSVRVPPRCMPLFLPFLCRSLSGAFSFTVSLSFGCVLGGGSCFASPLLLPPAFPATFAHVTGWCLCLSRIILPFLRINDQDRSWSSCTFPAVATASRLLAAHSCFPANAHSHRGVVQTCAKCLRRLEHTIVGMAHCGCDGTPLKLSAEFSFSNTRKVQNKARAPGIVARLCWGAGGRYLAISLPVP